MFFWNYSFFHDPADDDNLISGSSAVSKTSLNIWKFMVHTLRKPGLENFEHYFSVWDECNCAVVWTFFSTAFLCDWNENWPFPVLWPLLHFPNLLAYWVNTFTASSFTIWNSSARIPSLPLALFVVMLSKATYGHIPRCLALCEWSHHHDYLGREDIFCTVLLCILATSYFFFFLILKSLILTCVSKHEPPSHFPPHNISLGHPHAPFLSFHSTIFLALRP